MVHRNTANRRGKSPAQIMFSRDPRVPIVSEKQLFQRILYRPYAKTKPIIARYLFRQGRNTSLIAMENNRIVLAHDDQIAPCHIQPTGDNQDQSRYNFRRRDININYRD